MVNMGEYRCLCSIPVIEASPADNKTATELAKAEEAREETRAVTSGWGLIANLEDTCLYYVSGWWSYSFCQNTEIVQYHALASSPPGQPPKRDLHSPEYVLGRVPMIPPLPKSAEKSTVDDHDVDPIPAQLQAKGKQRYLVQKLVGGTICDLTQRERTIEVQYHCVPGIHADKISWIKEVTICAYVMVIDTPRLCNDAAFLPPKPTRANAISCQLVSNEASLLIDQKSQGYTKEEPAVDGEGQSKVKMGEAEAAAAAAASALKELLRDIESDAGLGGRRAVVGDITVGSRGLLSAADEAGRTPFKLTPPRSFMSNAISTETKLQSVVVAKGASREDGGKVESLTRAELKKLEIDPDTVQDMADQIQKIAGDAGWRLEVSDSGLAGVRELKGYIDEDDDEETAGKKTKAKAKRDSKNTNKAKTTTKPKVEKKQPHKTGEESGKKIQKQGLRDKEAAKAPEVDEQNYEGESGEEDTGSQEEFYDKDEL